MVDIPLRLRVSGPAAAESVPGSSGMVSTFNEHSHFAESEAEGLQGEEEVLQDEV